MYVFCFAVAGVRGLRDATVERARTSYVPAPLRFEQLTVVALCVRRRRTDALDRDGVVYVSFAGETTSLVFISLGRFFEKNF